MGALGDLINRVLAALENILSPAPTEPQPIIEPYNPPTYTPAPITPAPTEPQPIIEPYNPPTYTPAPITPAPTEPQPTQPTAPALDLYTPANPSVPTAPTEPQEGTHTLQVIVRDSSVDGHLSQSPVINGALVSWAGQSGIADNGGVCYLTARIKPVPNRYPISVTLQSGKTRTFDWAVVDGLQNGSSTRVVDMNE